MTDGVLVLVRHGQSEWNALNLFTGWRDPDLTETGIAEAKNAGMRLKAGGYVFDIAYTSMLTRADHTLRLILERLGQSELTTVRDKALNERDYGELSGLNKDDARARWGEDQVHIWRRSFDMPPPGGESLKDTAARTLPFYRAHILPAVLAGRNVIVAAHGNSLRSIVMDIEGLSPAEILKVEIATGVPIIYRLDAEGGVAHKLVLEAA
ncbi:MAG: 2,3-bisphosphoglycerate-dependent phosphoglycerate mutase [Hyphomicrobiaceae bacterium]